MYDVRGSKQQAMDWAAKKWLQRDDETPVDQFKRWAKRVPGATADQFQGAPTAESIVESTRRQNRFNPKGLHRDHRGRLLDKWGREMQTDWDDFEKRRGKQMNPLHNATGAIHKVSEMLESTDWDAKIRKMEKSIKGKAKKATKTIKGWEKGLGKARPKGQ